MNKSGREIETASKPTGINPSRSVVRIDAVAHPLIQVFTFFNAEPNKSKLQKVLEEESANLKEDLREKGLLGEHPLVRATITREPVSQAHGAIDGNLFGFSGEFDSSTRHRSHVTFAWEDSNGLTVFSEIPLESVRIAIDEPIGTPTVVFEFEEDKLLTVENVILRGTVTRFVSPNCNDYIKRALATATFRASRREDLQQFLLIPEPNR